MKGIFLNGTCCLIPFLLPIVAIGMVLMFILGSMFFGGIIMLIIGIALTASLRKKEINVKLYKEEHFGDNKENVANGEVVNAENRSSISNDIEFSNEIKAINILSVVTKILIILGIAFMLPLTFIVVSSRVTRYQNSLSYQYNLPKTNYDYDEYMESAIDDSSDYYRPIEDAENRVVVDKENIKEKGFVKDDNIYIYYRHLDINERSKFSYNGSFSKFYIVYNEDFDARNDDYQDVYSIRKAKDIEYNFYLLDKDEDIYVCIDKNIYLNDYDNDRDYLIKRIKENYKEKNIPMKTTLRFFDEFEVNDYNIYLDTSIEDIEKLSNNYKDEKIVTLPKGSIDRKYYISVFSIDKIFREIYPVAICEDNRLYGFKDEKENGEVELYKIPSVLQNRIKKQIEKYKDRIKNTPKFDDGKV